MTADWPTSGAVPVFTDKDGVCELAGYTKFTLRQPGTHRFVMIKEIEGDETGRIRIVGEAQVFER